MWTHIRLMESAATSSSHCSPPRQLVSIGQKKEVTGQAEILPTTRIMVVPGGAERSDSVFQVEESSGVLYGKSTSY